jgi:hypothetical protein
LVSLIVVARVQKQEVRQREEHGSSVEWFLGVLIGFKNKRQEEQAQREKYGSYVEYFL